MRYCFYWVGRGMVGGWGWLWGQLLPKGAQQRWGGQDQGVVDVGQCFWEQG